MQFSPVSCHWGYLRTGCWEHLDQIPSVYVPPLLSRDEVWHPFRIPIWTGNLLHDSVLSLVSAGSCSVSIVS
jgi:hypothetical protein